MTRTVPLLFEKFPDLESSIHWKHIGDFPTPVKELTNLEMELAHQSLWMKRDDLTNSAYGGNKIRKLEFILGNALERKSKWILTFGGIGSNHALATTIFANEVGIDVVLGLIDQPITAHVQENLLLFKHFGARLSYAKNSAGAVLKSLWHLMTKRGVYFLGPGGSSVIGNLGYVEAGLELAQQIDEGILPKPERIYLPVGTMGTYAGLHIGFAIAGLDVDLIGVRVTEEGMTNEKKLAKLINSTTKYLKSASNMVPDIKVHENELTLRHDFVGPCYGSITDQGIEAISIMQQKEDVRLETTYTGKALACMLYDIRKDELSSEPILFWNTYNSVDMSQFVRESGSYLQLPRSFHKFFSEILSTNITLDDDAE